MSEWALFFATSAVYLSRTGGTVSVATGGSVSVATGGSVSVATGGSVLVATGGSVSVATGGSVSVETGGSVSVGAAVTDVGESTSTQCTNVFPWPLVLLVLVLP